MRLDHISIDCKICNFGEGFDLKNLKSENNKDRKKELNIFVERD
jgi:hypothetical protein